MDKNQTMQYIEENFNISGESFRLINNILDFVSNQTDEKIKKEQLHQLLDGTIGLLHSEIEKINI